MQVVPYRKIDIVSYLEVNHLGIHEIYKTWQ